MSRINSTTKMTATVHPHYTNTKLVPEYVVPASVRAASSIIGVLGGAAIGIACDDMLTEGRGLGAPHIQALSRMCAENVDDCAILDLAASAAPGHYKIAVAVFGISLLLLAIMLEVSPNLRRAWANHKAGPADSPGGAPAEVKLP